MIQPESLIFFLIWELTIQYGLFYENFGVVPFCTIVLYLLDKNPMFSIKKNELGDIASVLLTFRGGVADEQRFSRMCF